MKTSTTVFVAVCGIIAIGLVCLKKSQTTTAVAPPATNSVPDQSVAAVPEKVSAPAPASTPAPTQVAAVPAPVAAAAPAVAAAKVDDAANAIHKAVDD